MNRSAQEQATRFNARDFRNALGTFGTGVTVVTTRAAGGELFGMTVNSFSSVSLDPPLILWTQSLFAPSLRAFEDATCFAVNVLGHEHRDVAMRFATSAKDKFAGVGYSVSSLGIPLLDGAAAHFECRTENRFEGGDHVIILGRVERYRYERKPTLLFCHGRYHRAHPLDENP